MEVSTRNLCVDFVAIHTETSLSSALFSPRLPGAQ